MALKLNETREPHKEFYGRNVDQMPKLIADDRVPMSFAYLIQKKLSVRNASEVVRSAWTDNYFDLGDAVAYHPDGRVKVVYDSQTLREMTPESPRNGGALVLSNDAYNALQGEEFKKGKLGTINDGMSKEDVKAHPVWRVLARDQNLLNEYTDATFADYKEKFAKDANIDDLRLMGIYPGSCGGKTPEMRAWFAIRLGGRADASGRFDLVLGNGRLVGLAPEAQVVAPGMPIVSQLEAQVQTALGAKKSFRHNGTLYVPVAENAGL